MILNEMDAALSKIAFHPQFISEVEDCNRFRYLLQGHIIMTLPLLSFFEFSFLESILLPNALSQLHVAGAS